MSKLPTASVLSSAANSISAYITPLLPTSMSSVAGASSHSSSSPTFSSLSSPAGAASSGPEPTFSRDLDRLYHMKVRPLLDAVDELRGLLVGEPIRLPTIVVVGDQSSGKSSVLEALSGVSLPRGQNITTRCPLVLRLINSTPAGSKDKDSAPYAIIGLTPVPGPQDERIMNLDSVGRLIEEYTIKLAGRSTGVSATPIYLSVYRPNSPDLTLVDLPGITRNPVGDQPKDIYHQIKGMIYSFIRPEESVILNVMPATVDFPTCECVMMSKEVDPLGQRTIGVVSKLDLAEKGIRKKLEIGVEQLGLRLGVVAVRNRSPDENERGISWESAREIERDFFRSHSELSALVGELSADSFSIGNAGDLHLGTGNLAILLAQIQEQRIRSTLPKIKGQIKELLQENREKLKGFPPSCTSPSECRLRFDQLLNGFLHSIAALARGDHSVAQGNAKLHLNPRLAEFYTTFQQNLIGAASKHFTVQFAREVEEEIKENSGVTLPNFLSQQVFKSLIQKELIRMNSPSQALLEQVKSLLMLILNHFLKQHFQAFPPLIHRISTSIQAFLDRQMTVSASRLDELLASEEEIFTLNTYYMDLVNKIKAVLYDKLFGPNSQNLRSYQASQANANGSGGSKPSKTVAFLSAVASSAIGGGQRESSANATDSPSPSPFMLSQPINDLILSVDLANMTLPPSPQSISGSNSASNTVLDMQINCYSYSQIVQKRLSDQIPLLCRYHFVRAISHYSGGFHSYLQQEFADFSDKQLVELMREDREIAVKREKLSNSVQKLEKALQVFDRL